jgi:hypothetical protein
MMAASSSSAPAVPMELTCTAGLNRLSDVDVWLASQYFLLAMFHRGEDAVLRPAEVMAELNRQCSPPWYDDWDGPELIPPPRGEDFNVADMVTVVEALIIHSADERQWYLDAGVETPSALHMMQALLADVVLEMERRRGLEGRWSHGEDHLPSLASNSQQADMAEVEDPQQRPKRVKQAARLSY